LVNGDTVRIGYLVTELEPDTAAARASLETQDLEPETRPLDRPSAELA
jgi:hypothetical protein